MGVIGNEGDMMVLGCKSGCVLGSSMRVFGSCLRHKWDGRSCIGLKLLDGCDSSRYWTN